MTTTEQELADALEGMLRAYQAGCFNDEPREAFRAWEAATGKTWGAAPVSEPSGEIVFGVTFESGDAGPC